MLFRRQIRLCGVEVVYQCSRENYYIIYRKDRRYRSAQICHEFSFRSNIHIRTYSYYKLCFYQLPIFHPQSQDDNDSHLYVRYNEKFCSPENLRSKSQDISPKFYDMAKPISLAYTPIVALLAIFFTFGGSLR